MMTEIEKIPKVDLHNHLDGSVPLTTLRQLANNMGEEYSLEQIRNFCQATEAKSLNEYLQKFDFPLRLLQTRNNLIMATREIIKAAAQKGVIYLELRFAPTLHTQGSLNLDEVIAAVEAGVDQGQQIGGITVRLIVIAMREQPEAQALATYQAGMRHRAELVVGGDLAGDEAPYPLEKFQTAFAWAKQQHFPLTIHAGEDGATKNIITAINYGARRIGHGVAGKDQTAVLKLAQARQVAFEICLKSNLDTQAIAAVADSPFSFYYQNGLSVSLNTDDQTVSATDENQEYARAALNFNLTLADFYRIDRMAVAAAFCDQATKNQLNQLLTSKFRELGLDL